MQAPPPAYSGGNEPGPPAYQATAAVPVQDPTKQPPAHKPFSRAPAPAAPAGASQPGAAVYWTYWGVLFGTLITWVFAVSATAHDELVESGTFGLEQDCTTDVKFCELFNAAKGFQYTSTILLSLILVLVVVAAFMPAAITQKLGLALGISLVVYAVFQLIAFSLMAAFVEEYNKWFTSELTVGPNVALAIMAWIFGTAEAVVTLVLFKRATTSQDGPFRRMMGGTGAANPAAPAAAPAGTAAPAVSYPTVAV